MRVDWNEVICGQPIIRLREMLRIVDDQAFRSPDVARYLKIKPGAAKEIINELVRRGWLEPADASKLTSWHRKKRGPFYQRSIAGNGFAIARAVKRISRTRAETILKGFVRRIKEVNANDEFGWYVREVHLFGSYLDASAEDLGDIDIAIELRRRPIIGRENIEHSKRRARASGKVFNDYFKLITYAEREVRLYLKNKDPYISMHDPEDIKATNAKSKLLYRAPKKDAEPRAARGPGPANKPSGVPKLTS